MFSTSVAGRCLSLKSALTALMSAQLLFRSNVNPRHVILCSRLLTSGVSIIKVNDHFIFGKSHIFFLDNWQYADKALTKDQSGGPYDQRCRTPCSQEKCFYMIDDQDNGVPGQSGFCDPSDIPKGKWSEKRFKRMF